MDNQQHYVDVNKGSDNNEGSFEKPFYSIQKAVLTAVAGDTIFIREGTYRERVNFFNSGQEDKKIYVKGFKGEKVVISGLEIISNWNSVQDTYKYESRDMDWTLGRGRNMIFANGEVLVEARFPKKPHPDFEYPVKGLDPLWPTFGRFMFPEEKRNPDNCEKFINDNPPYPFVSDLLKGLPKDYFKDADYVGINGFGWCAQSGVVDAMENGLIKVGMPSSRWFWHQRPAGWVPDEGKGMISGHMNCLDTPGDWVWQGEGENQGKVTLWTPENKDPKELLIEAKKRHVALNFSNVSHIEVSDIEIFAASVCINDCSDIVIDRCKLKYTSHFVTFDDGRNGYIESCGDKSIIKSGEIGVFVGGNNNKISNSTIYCSAGFGVCLSGYHNTLHNNLIDNTGYACTYVGGVSVGGNHEEGEFNDYHQGGHTISHNTIKNVGRSCIGLDGFNNQEKRDDFLFEGLLLTHNIIANGLLQPGDGGLLSSWHTNWGAFDGVRSEVSYNIFYGDYDRHDFGVVYPDNFSHNIDFHHNIVAENTGMDKKVYYVFNRPAFDISWHDNSCLGVDDFKEDLKKLPQELFPEGKRFSAGHDFDVYPKLFKLDKIEEYRLNNENSKKVHEEKNYSVISYEDVDLSEGFSSIAIKYANGNRKATNSYKYEFVAYKTSLGIEFNGEKALGEAMSWLQFENVNFGEFGYEIINIEYSKGSLERTKVFICEGSIAGNVLAEFELEYTGGEEIFRKRPVTIRNINGNTAKGLKDIYIIFENHFNSMSLRSFTLSKMIVSELLPRFQRTQNPVVMDVQKLYALKGSKMDSKNLSMFWDILENIENNSWVLFKDVDFKEGYRNLIVQYGKSSEAPAGIEMRIDSLQGEVIAEMELSVTEKSTKLTKGIHLYTTQVAPLNIKGRGVKEKHDVYFIFNNCEKHAAEITAFHLDDAINNCSFLCGKNKIEVRLGDINGEVIGELPINYTGVVGVYDQGIIPINIGELGKNEKVSIVIRGDKDIISAIDVKEVSFRRAKTSIERGLVGKWSFNTGKGHVVFDEANRDCISDHGFVFPDTATGEYPKWIQKSQDRYAMAFNGSNGLLIGDSSEMSPGCRTSDSTYHNEITVMAKVTLYEAMKGEEYKIKVATKADIENKRGYSLWVDKVNSFVVFTVMDGESEYNAKWNYEELKVNESCTLVGTFNGHIVKLYFNGELVGTDKFKGNIYHTANPLILGCGLKGELSEVKIYNRALNSEEVELI